MIQQKITILIEVPKEEIDNIIKGENNSKDTKLECLQEAKKDALNSMNLVLHEIEASEKMTAIIRKSHKADPIVQDFTRYTNELIQETKQVLKKCTAEDWKEVEGN